MRKTQIHPNIISQVLIVNHGVSTFIDDISAYIAFV